MSLSCMRNCHPHLDHAILIFLDAHFAHPNSARPKIRKKHLLYGKFHEVCSEATKYLNHIFLWKSIVFTPLLHSRAIGNCHCLLKLGFFEIANPAKLTYSDCNLLNRKMVVAKTLIKLEFLLIFCCLYWRSTACDFVN